MDKPKNGGTYFYVTDEGKIGEDRWLGTETDNNRLKFNNAFTQRTEAHNRLKAITTKATSRPMAVA